MDYNVSIVLDTRRAKSTGLYPVKLRIYSIELRKKQLYATNYDLSEKDFTSIWETKKPRTKHREIRNELLGIELRADDICKTLKPFSFAEFDKKYRRNSGDGINIIYQYNQTLSKLKSNNRLGTESNYDLSLKSLLAYVTYVKGKQPAKLLFTDITPDWLEKYESYMINRLKRSRATVGIYLRPLRAIFNLAIADKEINAEIYPFGKNKYQPPAVRNVKKAFPKEDLKTLFNAKPLTPEQAKAKAFWFFSYACNGMNVKDVALLKCGNVQDDKIIFYRHKTINTSKKDLRPVTVYLNKFTKSVIKKYGNKKTTKGSYIFPIVSDKESELVKRNKIKNFTKFINQNLKKLAKSVGLTEEISNQWARHSFATNAIRNGASMEYVMEALSHNNMKTTVGYFAGFEDKDKKEFAGKLMDF